MASRNVSTVEKAIRTLKQRLVSLGDMRLAGDNYIYPLTTITLTHEKQV